MTIEQAIQTLQANAKLLHFEHPHLGLEEAIGVVIEALSEPAQPLNLDEAAEEYAKRGVSSNADPYEEIIAYRADKDAFKAGAEWMAGQGWVLDGEVKDMPTGGGDCEIYLDYDYGEMQSILDKICDHVNNNCPDDENRYKVTIQVRKI